MTDEVKIMVGCPASGKSSFVEREAKKLKDEHLTTCIISRDYIRKSFLDDNEGYFNKETEVFNEFIRQINEAMKSDIDVIFVDATHLNMASRNKLLSRLFPDSKTNLTFEVMKTPLNVCINRNNKRTGFAKVPVHAILKMAKNFKEPTEEEFPKNKWGFNKIKVNIYEEGWCIWKSGLPQIFISDFNHDREFIWKSRGFNSIQEMNEEIIRRYNEVVNLDDEVYILGDLMFGKNQEDNINLIKQLKGKKTIIRGNHDGNTKIKIYTEILNIPVFDALHLKINGYNFYLSHYPTITENFDDGKSLKTKIISLCGHYHTSNPFEDMKKGILSYHVEVDAHNCFPVSLNTIIEDILNFYGQK